MALPLTSMFQGDESGFMKVDGEIHDSSVFINKKTNLIKFRMLDRILFLEFCGHATKLHPPPFKAPRQQPPLQ